MTRELTGNSIANESDIVLPISIGGTESITYETAAENLQYPLSDMVGYPTGLTPLDLNGFIPGNAFPNIILNRTGVQVSGPLSVGIGITSTYTISNYVSTTTYTVSALGGSVSISGSTISYTAPLTIGLSGFVINGSSVSINVVDPGKTPTVSGPTTLLENSQGTYTITNYDANSTYNVTAVQGSVIVSGATITYTAPAGDGINNINAGFNINGVGTLILITAPATPFITGPTSIPYLTSTTFTITNYQSPGTYNVSISNGNGTISISGNIITYTSTSANAIPITIKVNAATYTFNLVTPIIATPSILSPVNGANNLGPTLNFTSSVFSAPGTSSERQTSSNWQLATDPAFTNIAQSSYNDTVNLTTWSTNNLTANTTYYVRVQYIDQFGNGSSYSPAVGFSTKTIYTPTAITGKISSNIAGSWYSNSISMNSDGTVVIVGAPNEGSNGAAYIYNLVNGTWTQTTRIGSSDNSFGLVVSINSTGTVAIIISSGASSYTPTGVAYVYNLVNGTWTQTVGFSTFINLSKFGNSVSLSSDGTVAILGAPGENTSAGAAYIYNLVNGTWTRTVRLATGIASAQYGFSVSINSTGTIAMVGAYYEGSNAGAVYIYNLVNGTWTQSARLATGIGSSYFGNSVSINSTGTVAIIGADGENASTGAVYVYNLVNGTWNQTARLASGAANSGFGSAISLNSTGTVAIIGAPYENNNVGASYIYNLVNGTWTQSANISSNIASSNFGYSVSLDSVGDKGIVGTPYENSFIGAVYFI